MYKYIPTAPLCGIVLHTNAHTNTNTYTHTRTHAFTFTPPYTLRRTCFSELTQHAHVHSQMAILAQRIPHAPHRREIERLGEEEDEDACDSLGGLRCPSPPRSQSQRGSSDNQSRGEYQCPSPGPAPADVMVQTMLSQVCMS